MERALTVGNYRREACNRSISCVLYSVVLKCQEQRKIERHPIIAYAISDEGRAASSASSMNYGIRYYTLHSLPLKCTVISSVFRYRLRLRTSRRADLNTESETEC